MEIKDSKNIPERELVLHHLDRVLDSYKESLKFQNRTMILLNISSLIVIALSSGIVSVSQNFSFLGTILTVPTWLILLSSAYLLGILFISFINLFAFSQSQSRLIEKLYENAGYPNNQLNENEQPFISLYSNVFDIIINSFDYYINHESGVVSYFYTIVGVSMFLVIVLLPFAAEIFTFYKLIVIFNLVWWTIFSIIIVLLLYIVGLFGFISNRF